LSQKWGLIPMVRNTPSGGRMIANMIRSMLIGNKVAFLFNFN